MPIMHKVPYVDKTDRYYGNYTDDLGEYDEKDLDAVGVVECWYSYAVGSYDGSGLAITKSEDGKYGVEYLSHCSCHGPCDNSTKPVMTIDELRNYKTDDADMFANLLKELG